MRKANSKNRMPKGMICAAAGGSGSFLALYLADRLSGMASSAWRTAMPVGKK